ncbi:uncharacterized protein LOC122569015 isoform X2 [Bombus pyrosoma]|uniref:uncharacterized protein LOC122569015 isoform X2 n=1 Tax=Bombus pyrosoma TaxID=396416 RepID=UPI001CB9195A|nr:uncharacterized protein LOC122569015 isoform X2 [Bombus pyrosoma]
MCDYTSSKIVDMISIPGEYQKDYRANAWLRRERFRDRWLGEEICTNNVVNSSHDRSSTRKDGIKITDLTSKVTSMRDTLQSEKQTLEYKNHVLSKHLDHITELDAEKNKFLEECQQLELQRNKLKTCKRNIQDQELLDQGRRKYALYRELTGIRWDFGKLKENITGNIYKGVYIHHFSYSNEENTKDLNNLLWQEIYQSVIHNEHKNTYDKENTVQNK